MATKKATKAVQPEKMSFEAQLKENMSLPGSFEVQKLGPSKVKRSIIPKDKAVRRLIIIDGDSDLQMSIEALKRGVTLDELYRQVAWTFLALR